MLPQFLRSSWRRHCSGLCARPACMIACVFLHVAAPRSLQVTCCPVNGSSLAWAMQQEATLLFDHSCFAAFSERHLKKGGPKPRQVLRRWHDARLDGYCALWQVAAESALKLHKQERVACQLDSSRWLGFRFPLWQAEAAKMALPILRHKVRIAGR